MAKSKNKGGRTGSATVVGISLLLFLLGVFAYILATLTTSADTMKEQLVVDILFREEAREVDILKMEKELSAMPHVLAAQYVSKASAKALMMERLGDDSFDILDGANPLRPSIAVNLASDYVNADSAMSFQNKVLSGNEHVIEDVSYDSTQFLELTNTFSWLRLIILTIGAILLFIAMALINNTIRLTVYSKRFTIKTMQLVGAKPSFIRRPFLYNALGQGLLSGIIAVGLLVVFGYFFGQISPGQIDRITANEVQLQKEFKIFALLFGGIILLGIFVSWVSTYFALSKYIWIKTEKLY
jgi:cell division transport system permease protein